MVSTVYLQNNQLNKYYGTNLEVCSKDHLCEIGKYLIFEVAN
jgi:hypothetical protein